MFWQILILSSGTTQVQVLRYISINQNFSLVFSCFLSLYTICHEKIHFRKSYRSQWWAEAALSLEVPLVSSLNLCHSWKDASVI